MEILDSAERSLVPSQAVFKAACRDVAGATGANRVSIWDFDPDCESIRCACFYEVPEDRFTSGHVLTAAELPAYFETILSEKFIVATEARDHPAAVEPVDPYFLEHDIYSLLDFIIHDNFEPIGVICCENAEEVRRWREEDASYLQQISTLISFRLKRS